MESYVETPWLHTEASCVRQRAHGFIFQLSSVVTDRLHLHPPASVGGPLAVSQLENGSPALVILIYIHGHVRSLSPPPKTALTVAHLPPNCSPVLVTSHIFPVKADWWLLQRSSSTNNCSQGEISFSSLTLHFSSFVVLPSCQLQHQPN